ncbi:OmpA family protein [Vibrio tapetis]|uniref:Outer membrane protein n=1 Tax=Vibrio tapetis subsp. tapetis TaxID=1671868 RepID=A0A2N8ZMJ1_9VIBR|nr:OmpA family protein [Vibrio tapetis]SON53130.1 Outer membrane protein [Vibrio tapetis subsp. tapetis]
MKLSFKYAIGLLATAWLSGCTSYPDNGTGGLAENYTGSNYASTSFSPVMPDEPLGPEHGLRFDWQIAKLHLDSLIREGAKWCFPASVVQAQEKQNRIARELEGGLLLDAANDIIILRRTLNDLELRLDYVTSQTRCVPPRDQAVLLSRLDIINQLFELLNVDNQFAYDSIEINPKYMGHLAEAATILREHKDFTIVVTGHADSSGTDEHNDKLAMGRAKQVKRYLSIFGLAPERIKTSSLGSSLPLFEGDTAAVKLTNRRVSIEVIAPANTAESALGGQHDRY